MEYTLSESARAKLVALLRDAGGDAAAAARGTGSRVRFVECLSAYAEDGGYPTLAESYPGRILEPAADGTLPPEAGGLVLLSVVGDGGAAQVPTAGRVYLCLLAGDTPADASGSIAGRPRAFGVPTAPSDDWLAPVKAAATGNVGLAAAASRTHDGITLGPGDRTLLWQQSTNTENGVYVVNTDYSLSRAADCPAGRVVRGLLVYVTAGTLWGRALFANDSAGGSIGSGASTWAQVYRHVTGTGSNPIGPTGSAGNYTQTNYLPVWASYDAVTGAMSFQDSNIAFVQTGPSTLPDWAGGALVVQSREEKTGGSGLRPTVTLKPDGTISLFDGNLNFLNLSPNYGTGDALIEAIGPQGGARPGQIRFSFADVTVVGGTVLPAPFVAVPNLSITGEIVVPDGIGNTFQGLTGSDAAGNGYVKGLFVRAGSDSIDGGSW